MPAFSLQHQRARRPDHTGRRLRRGFTLVEVIIALGLTGLVFAAVTSQLVESSKLSRRITRTLEHSRNARELIDTLSADVRAAQIMRLHSSFADRATVARDGETGNYLVLHFIDARGVIKRTVGYYVIAAGGPGGWALFRHDSALGDSAAGNLPGADTAGRHRLIKQTVRLPDSNHLFRCARDRAVSIHGEFGAGDAGGSTRSDFIHCTISTRS